MTSPDPHDPSRFSERDDDSDERPGRLTGIVLPSFDPEPPDPMRLVPVVPSGPPPVWPPAEPANESARSPSIDPMLPPATTAGPAAWMELPALDEPETVSGGLEGAASASTWPATPVQPTGTTPTDASPGSQQRVRKAFPRYVDGRLLPAHPDEEPARAAVTGPQPTLPGPPPPVPSGSTVGPGLPGDAFGTPGGRMPVAPEPPVTAELPITAEPPVTAELPIAAERPVTAELPVAGRQPTAPQPTAEPEALPTAPQPTAPPEAQVRQQAAQPVPAEHVPTERASVPRKRGLAAGTLHPGFPEATARAMRILPIAADLLPPEIVDSRRERRVRRLVVSGLAGVVALLVAWYGMAAYETSVAEDNLIKVDEDTRDLTRQQNAFSDLVKTQADAKVIAEQLRVVLAQDLQWSTLLSSLQAAAPKGVTITGVTGSLAKTGDAAGTGTSIGLIMLTGTAPSKAVVAAYVDALAKVSGIANPFPTDAVEDDREVQFTVRMDITKAALGGRYTTPTATPTPSSTGGK